LHRYVLDFEGASILAESDGGGKHGMHFLIRLAAPLGETFASSSSLSCDREIKGLVSNSSLLLLL